MTERTAIRQSMVDDDAISLTSTAVSEYDSDAEFSVDRILAERTESGKKRYLIFWEGYPLEKATWEPHKNINDEILEAWKERKSQESKGLEAPFNVAEFDALLARLATEKADRRRRRKAKRRRLGRTVSPSASEADDSDSSIEAIEENEVEDVKPGSKRKSKSPPKKPAKAPKSSTGRRESTSSLASIDAPRKAPVKKASGMSKQSSDRSHPPSRQASEASRHSRTLSHSSSDTPLSKRRSLRRNSIVRPSSSSSEGPLAPPKPTAAAPKPPATAPKSSATESNHPASTSKPPAPAPKPTTTAPTASNVWKLTAARKTTSNSEPSTLSDELPPTRGAYSSRGRVATRGGGNVAHKNVFQPREPPKKRGTLLKNAMDPAKAPKKFSNMRLHRKAELQSRDLAEGAPDINALGGLFDPSRPDSMVPIRPENLRKTSSNMVSSEKEPNPLFVNSRESSPGASDLRRMANNQPQPPEQVSSALRGLSICYYWDKQQKGTDQPPCKMGTACRFLHRYAPGVPIAPPPISVGPDIRGTAPAGPSQSTCFFWDRGIKFGKEFGCGKGDLCPYQHRYEEGMPIAAPPTGFVDNDTSRSKTLDDPQRAFIYSQAPLTERHLPVNEKFTCYFWDRAQRDNKFPTCSRGDSCTYHHGYEAGMPIAPPPHPISKPSDGSRDPSTDDFAPWPADSSESRPQDPAPLPPWRTGSGDTSQADSAQQDVFTPVPDLTTVLQTLRTTNDSPMDPAHERRPEAPLKETTIPNGEAPSRPAWDPYMPTHAICHFYFNNGSCSKEFRCKYIHSLAPSLPIAPSIREQAKIFARTPCLDFQKGFCRYTATSDCRFLHHTESPKKKDEVRKEQSAASPQARSSRLVSEQGASSTDTSLSEVRVITNPTSGSSRGPAAEFHHIMPPRAPKSQTRPEWDPFDPFNSICYFWYTNGDCIKGRNCNFAHNEDPDLPIAPAPQDQAAIKKSAAQEADRLYASKIASSRMPTRDKAPEKKAVENLKDQPNLIRESSSSRHPLSPRVNAVSERKDKADVDPRKAASSSKDSARSPLHSTTSTPPKTKPRPTWNPRDPLNAICFFLATTGTCPEERDCQYIHSNDPNLAVAPSPLEISGRPAWDSRNPLHAICYFLASTGSCTSGSRCKFFHSNDPTLPIAPSPTRNEIIGPTEYDERGRPTCRYWLRDDCNYVDSTCRFWHGPLSAKERYELATHGVAREQPSSPTKPTTTGSRAKSVSFAFGEDMPLVDEPESLLPSRRPVDRSRPIMSPTTPAIDNSKPTKSICFHWTQGTCYHGAACWFRHGYAPGEGPNEPSEDVPMRDRAEKHSNAPAQSSKDSRDIAMQDRVEKQPTQIPARRTEGSKDIEMQYRVEKQPASIRRTESGRDIEMKDAAEISRPAMARKPSVRFAMSENEMPTATEVPESVPHPGIINTAGLPAPSSGLPVIGTKTMPKTKIDEYRRYTTQRELASGAKEVTFGLDETQSFILDFGDLNQTLGLPWGFSFSGITRIRFDQMCIAQDFQAQQGLLQRLRLWHGNMLSIDAKDSQTVEAVDKAADELIRRSAGLFASFPDFLVLAFPAKRLEWKFLESTLDYPQDARLRYLIFQSNVDIRQSFKIKPTSLEICAYRDVLVEKIHGLDINRLLPVFRKSKPKPPNVYLLFPSTAAQTADFIISWLRSSNRSCKVYTSQSEGSWQYFTHTPEIDQGIVLVHESAAAQLYRLPNLYSVAAEKNFAFWYISESSSPYPLFPSTSYYFDDSTMGQLNAVRLFPHGCAFLLTPSFLVAEPHNALQVLNWFICGGGKPKYLLSTPRTWKLVCCHKLADYILEIANSKAAEKDALELKHRDNPAKDAILHDTGLSFNECNIRYKLHRLLVDFESKRSLESFSEFESDSDESDYPFIHANKHINPDNEKALVEWFAEWTMRNLDMYKKFVVVGSSEPKQKVRLTRMKEQEVVRRKGPIAATESPRPPIANFRTFSITKNANASPIESPQSPLSAQKQKALAVAARLSATPSPSNNINQSRGLEQNPFDDLAVKAASSPSRRNGQKSRLSNVQSPQDGHGTGLGINLDEQISELIAESNKTLPHLDTANAAASHANGSSNQTPISSSSNRTKDHRSPPQLDGVDDQSVEMDLDSPMLGFDGAADERPSSSSSSRSGIQSDENGRRFVPRSIRPDASVRKEILVRPGYVPPEDGEFYQIPSRRGSAAGTPIGQNAVDVESENEKKKKKKPEWRPAEWVEDGEIEEVRMELKEVKFEATTTWYKREQKEGRGWEHIRVEGFEAAIKTLGIGK